LIDLIGEGHQYCAGVSGSSLRGRQAAGRGGSFRV